jgi:hypothetical protein
VIEKKRDSPTWRVQFLKDDSQEDLLIADVSHFFTGIELKSDTLTTDAKGGPNSHIVNFEIAMSANYAI